MDTDPPASVRVRVNLRQKSTLAFLLPINIVLQTKYQRTNVSYISSVFQRFQILNVLQSGDVPYVGVRTQ